MIKRIGALFLAVILCFSFVGCEKNNAAIQKAFDRLDELQNSEDFSVPSLFHYKLYRDDDGTRVFAVWYQGSSSVDNSMFGGAMKAGFFRTLKDEVLPILEETIGETDIIPYIFVLNANGTVYKEQFGW